MIQGRRGESAGGALSARRSCPSCSGALGRREFLQVGDIAGLGLALDDFFRLRTAQAEEAGAPPKEGPAKSVIHIFLPGGIAHQDSFDPKPYAPIEYRGELSTVPTKIEGVLFSEHLKETAGIADKIAVCRSVSRGEADHDRGTHNMFTGYRPSPALVFPSMGASCPTSWGRGRTSRPTCASRTCRRPSPAPDT